MVVSLVSVPALCSAGFARKIRFSVSLQNAWAARAEPLSVRDDVEMVP